MKFFITTLLLFSFSILSSQTQYQINQKVCEELNKNEKILDLLHKQIVEEYASDTLFIQKFQNTQKIWLKFRDAYVESIFPLEDKRSYGSVYPMCYCIHLLELTQERIKQLEKWTTGVLEGDVCGGSIKVKE